MASTAAASSGQHTARVLEVVGLLYCRTVSDDYRQPVELLLPQSKQLYRSVIKSPMDLGTLLLKAYKGELSPAMLRYGLRMVFNNAIIYNSDAPLMVSYSRHLNALAKALYEEIIKEPYDGDSMAELRASGLCSPDGSPTEALGDEAFPLLLRHKRWKRFCAYKSYQLSESELNRMLGILYSPQCLVPKDLESAVEEAKVLLQNRLQEKERDADISESEETLVSMEIVLKILLTPVVTSNSSAEPNLARMLSTLPIICGTEDFCGVIPKAECKQFLVWLDELSGVLLALIEERVLRGTTYSRVWAKPHHKLVWVQPAKDARSRSTLWPGMVVASAGVTDYELPKVVVASNLARIPDAVKKELNKVRPRLGDRAGVGVSTQSVDAPEKPKLVCPEGYLLVEFFDMHDFGWAKAESVVLLNGNGDLPYSGGKIGSDEAIREAMEAFHCLQDQHKHCGEAYADDEDIPMPSIDELEGILQWPQRPLDAVTTAIAPTINARVTSATPVATSTKKKRSNGESGGKAKSTKDDKKAKKGGDGKKYPYMIRPHGRRGLSFVAPETDLEYDKYIVDGVFQTSQCPVVDLSLMYSPSDTPGNSWYKENSLLRTRGAIHWMNKVRPLQLKEAVQTKPAISIKAKAVRGGGKGKENSLSQTKMRSSFSSVDNDVSVDLADGHVDVERSENRSSLSSAHTVSAGCTKFFAGEGVIHSRSVDMSSPLLLMYTVDAELRKKVLRAQLTRIDSELDKLIQAAVRRQQGGFQEEADLDGSSGVESEDDMDVEQSPESATQEGSSFKSEYTDTRSVQRRVAGSDPLAFI